jgi:hypothetical protein
MLNELLLAKRIADGTLPSPQQFGNSWYWAIRISAKASAAGIGSTPPASDTTETSK